METILYGMKLVCLFGLNSIDEAVVEELTSVSPTNDKMHHEIQGLIAALKSSETRDLLPDFLDKVFPTPFFDRMAIELEEIISRTRALGNKEKVETFDFSDPLHRESLEKWMSNSVEAGLDNSRSLMELLLPGYVHSLQDNH